MKMFVESEVILEHLLGIKKEKTSVSMNRVSSKEEENEMEDVGR